MSLETICLHFVHIEKTLKKALLKLASYCMVFFTKYTNVFKLNTEMRKHSKQFKIILRFLTTPIVVLGGEIKENMK